MRQGPQRQHFFGSHVRTLTAGDIGFTLSRASVPKEELPEHAHDGAHIIVAVDPGYVSRAFEAEEQGRGFDLIYNPSGTIHRDCFFETGGRFLSISLPANLAVPSPGPRRLPSPAGRIAAMRLLGLCIRDDANAGLPLEEGVLGLLADFMADADAQPSADWIRDADDLIEAGATQARCTIGGIARDLGLHPVYFARAYRARYGLGPAEVLQSRRAEAAAAMFSRDMPLSQIALRCGFADQSHMCRSVRKFTGVAPGAIRSAF